MKSCYYICDQIYFNIKGFNSYNYICCLRKLWSYLLNRDKNAQFKLKSWRGMISKETDN